MLFDDLTLVSRFRWALEQLYAGALNCYMFFNKRAALRQLNRFVLVPSSDTSMEDGSGRQIESRKQKEFYISPKSLADFL